MEEKKLHDGEITIESEEDVAKIRDQVKEEVIAENGLTPEQEELFKKAMDEASMPVEMKDADFTLGASELDIRSLSKKNQTQMLFRQGVLNVVYLKQLLTTAIDISRLLLIICDKLGIEDIVKATDDIIEKIASQNKDLQEVIKVKKTEEDA